MLRAEEHLLHIGDSPAFVDVVFLLHLRHAGGTTLRKDERQNSGVTCVFPGNYRIFQGIVRCPHRIDLGGSCWLHLAAVALQWHHWDARRVRCHCGAEILADDVQAEVESGRSAAEVKICPLSTKSTAGSTCTVG
jgi:hypothetical protein